MIYTAKISRYDIEILTKRNMKSSLPKLEDLKTTSTTLTFFVFAFEAIRYLCY